MEYPFGKTKGTPLQDCLDKDLNYLITYYTSPDKDGKSRLIGKYGATNQAMLSEAQKILLSRQPKTATPAPTPYTYSKDNIGTMVSEILERIQKIEAYLMVLHPNSIFKSTKDDF